MKNKSLLLLVLGACCLVGCFIDVYSDYLHYIRNNSDFDIFSYQAANTKYGPTVYPDTLLPDELYTDPSGGKFFYCYDSETGSNTDTLGIIRSKSYSVARGIVWDYYRAFSKKDFDKQFKAGYYSIFMISYNKYKEKGWEGIRNDYDILVRYDLTYDNLKALNDTIPFPPSETMKDMKMWPPYEEVIKRYK